MSETLHESCQSTVITQKNNRVTFFVSVEVSMFLFEQPAEQKNQTGLVMRRPPNVLEV